MSMQDDLDKWYPDTLAAVKDDVEKWYPEKWQIKVKDSLALLDELADLAELWKEHRTAGNTPCGIRAGMLAIIKQIEVE